MTPQQTEKEIGPPDTFRSATLNVREEFRALHLPILTYDETGISEITLSRQAEKVKILDINDIFTVDPLKVLRRIEKEDDDLREIMGIIVLIKLGVSLSGFHDGDEDQNTITVFRKGVWDDLEDSTNFIIS